jgi:hypothetical protein
VLFSFLLATACTTTTHLVPTNPPPRPMAPRAPETVEVYVGARPARPFVEIGILDDRRGIFVVDPSSRSWPEFIRHARESGARIGCDAVILEATGVARKGFWGTCLLYMSRSPGLARKPAR